MRVKRIRTSVEWSPHVAAMFGAVPDDWKPPRRVNIDSTRDRQTLSARFVLPDGSVNTVFARWRRDSLCGAVLVAERVELTRQAT